MPSANSGAKPRNIRYDVTAISDTDPPELVCTDTGSAGCGDATTCPRSCGSTATTCGYGAGSRRRYRKPAKICGGRSITVWRCASSSRRCQNPERDQATVDAGQVASECAKDFDPRPDMVGIRHSHGEPGPPPSAAPCARRRGARPHAGCAAGSGQELPAPFSSAGTGRIIRFSQNRAVAAPTWPSTKSPTTP